MNWEIFWVVTAGVVLGLVAWALAYLLKKRQASDRTRDGDNGSDRTYDGSDRDYDGDVGNG